MSTRSTTTYAVFVFMLAVTATVKLCNLQDPIEGPVKRTMCCVRGVAP
ncbi:MAG: hypothetical protein IPK85_01595 [Gemmatimonadetes bacterium]|nr:hypothetical protein [Gemmatimonadota bacterium]